MSAVPSADAIARRSRVRQIKERTIEFILFLAAVSSVVITIGIVGVLVWESALFFKHVSLWDFLTDTQWTPLFDDAHYGILPLLSGTLVTTAIALMVAIPVGTITAIYLSEYASHRAREVIKPIMELLSAVPTVVYGYFALLFITPLLQKFLPDLPGFNMLSAGLVIGIMIIPYVSSLSEDAIRAVPMHIREGSYAMGATRLQTSVRVVVPYPRNFACGRGDHGGSHRGWHATQSHVESDGACGNHHCLHRAGFARRPASRHGGLPDHLCSGSDPAAHDPTVQHFRILAAQAFPPGLLRRADDSPD